MPKPPDLLVVTGEPSGDQAAAAVMNCLRSMRSFGAFGIGGDALSACGTRLVAHIRNLSAIGLGAQAPRLGAWARAWARLREEMIDKRPRVALLVDSPETNLPLARICRDMGVRVVYYIGPQVWAWRRGRLGLMRERVDVAALVLPFEKPLYDAWGVPSVYVGHPVLDRGPLLAPDVVRDQLGPGRGRPLVAMLPGSRVGEVDRHARLMMEAGATLCSRGVDVVIAPPPSLRSSLGQVAGREVKIAPAAVSARDLLQVADAAVVASGTATLEAAVERTPMVAVYRLDWLSYAAGRSLVGIPFVALPNWIAGRKVVPELIQRDMTKDRIVDQVLKLLEPKERARQISALDSVVESLGGQGASARAAALVAERLE